MPWEDGNRRAELPPNWETLRRETLETDGYRCVWPGRWARVKGVRQCGAPATDVDHVKRGDDHSARNRQSLCARHHQMKTAQESAQVRRENQAKLRHPVAKHPGLK